MPVTLESPGPQTSLRITSPSGGKTDLKSGKLGKLSFTETGELGIYNVQSGGKTIDQFAVNLFDPGESDIRPNRSPTIKVGDVEVKGETALAGRPKRNLENRGPDRPSGIACRMVYL